METKKRLISNVTARHLLKILQENVTQRPHLFKLPGLRAEGPTVPQMWSLTPLYVDSSIFLLLFFQVIPVTRNFSCSSHSCLVSWGGIFLKGTGNSKGKAQQEVGAERHHPPFSHGAPSPKSLLEQVHEAGDAGLIETFKISSQWAHYRQALP